MVVELPGVAGVEGFRIWVAVIRVHHAADRALCQTSGCRRQDWQRINSKTPVLQLYARARDDICAVRDGECGLEYCGVCLLNHEQWDVLKYLSVIQPVTAAQNVLACAAQIIRKTD